MIPELSGQKKEIRQKMLARRRAISVEEIVDMERRLTDNLLSLPSYQKARRIMAFLPMKGEAGSDAFIRTALEEGKELYVPYLLDREGHMEAARLMDLDHLEFGALGLRKVPDCHEMAEPETMDLVLIPAAACDRTGSRVGMGKGYYDRYLTRVPPEKRAAVIWDFQLLPAVPEEPFDQAIPLIITEKRIYSAKGE